MQLFACSAALAISGAVIAAAACSSHGSDNAESSDASSQDEASPVVDAGPDGPISVQILAFNDFHGQILPPSPQNAAVLVPPGDPAIDEAGTPVQSGSNYVIHAGGAVYLAAHLAALRAENPNTIIVSAGDLTGASQLISGIYDEEPTIDIMNTLGLEVNGVGNHEFDHGLPTLFHFQDGGCDSTDPLDGGYGSCAIDKPFKGSTFEYLAANVDELPDAGGPTDGAVKTVFPPYVIKNVGGANIAFIGLTLSETSPYDPSEIGGLHFADEVTTTNALIKTLEAQNVDAMIVLVHQGGSQSGTYNECQDLRGAITSIAEGIDPAVAAIHSAHTHNVYNCVLDGRPVTSAAAFGRFITQFKLSVDPVAHKVLSIKATNVIVTRDVTPDPAVSALVNQYSTDVAPLADVQVGQITADIVASTLSNGESPLGDVVADSMLDFANAQGQQTDLGFVNIGGLRDSLYYAPFATEAPGDVTYAKAYAVEPFGDTVNVLECTGSDIIAAIQQNEFPGQLFQISNGFTYSWSASSQTASNFMLNGVALDPTATYHVAMPSFLQGGGDGYTAFTSCTNPVPVGIDLEALNAYLTAHKDPPLAPPLANRITRTN